MDDAGEKIPLGPAMSALTQLQRRFVLAMASDPLATPTEWARAAGYDPKGSDRVAGHDLSRSPKIAAAAQELGRANLDTFGPVLGIGVMMMIARNKEHPKQLRAAEMLANRGGFHEMTEHVVNVNHTDRTGAAMAKRIEALAATLGLDSTKLLGVNAGPKLIDAQSFPPDTFGTATLPPGTILSIDCE